MLFGFRGIRPYQALVAIAALAAGIGSIVLLAAAREGGSSLLLVPAVVLGLCFLWLFGIALRAPTAFVAVAPERTRIRFPGFVDTVVANGDIVAARVRRWPFYHGIGMRVLLGGEVGLITAWGDVAELTFREPVRVWLVPGLIPLRARRLSLSVRHPEKLVARFADGAASAAGIASASDAT